MKVLFCLLVLMLLSGCNYDTYDTYDLSMVSDVQNPVMIYEITPEQTTVSFLDPAALEQINAQLQSVQAAVVKDWMPGPTRWVIDYGYHGDDSQCIWSPPYWITPDGTVYRTRLNLEFRDEWVINASVHDQSYPIGGYYLAMHNGKTLDPAYLEETELPPLSDLQKIQITEVQEDRIAFTCINHCSAPWEMNQSARLLAELDGRWYLVPPNFELIRALVGIPLWGGSYENGMSLEPYPKLPKGRYAVLFDGAWDTFEIPR